MQGVSSKHAADVLWIYSFAGPGPCTVPWPGSGVVKSVYKSIEQCLDLQAYLHVQWLRFQHVSA